MQKPNKLACLTLDLEPDFYSADSHQVLLDEARFGQIEALLLRNELPLTVFVVARMLEEGLPVRERFARIDAAFELHSYSHDVEAPDSEREILLGREVFTRHLGRPPEGYRAPEGDISARGLRVLQRAGFRYDASIFPTWRPELGYDYRGLPNGPWRYADLDGLLEIPFAAVPRARVVISMSFLKLLGLPVYRVMRRLFGFPDVLVFDAHLHDFFPTAPVRDLPRSDWRRYAMLRNQRKALPLLQRFVDLLRADGYRFVHVGELVGQLEGGHGGPLPQVGLTARGRLARLPEP